MLIAHHRRRHAGAIPAPPPNFADDQQFEELYRAHYRHVVHLCRRLLGPGRDAEAMAQEVFLRAWRSRDAFQADRRFWPWIATITRRLCFNELRGAARRQELLRGVGASPDRTCAVDDAIDSVFQADDIRLAFQHLPKRQQRLLQLRDLEGWSYEEIARFHDITVESVRSTLKRARATFRRVYEEHTDRVLVGVGAFLRHLRVARRDAEQWAGVVGAHVANPAAWAITVAMLLPFSSASPPAAAVDRHAHAHPGTTTSGIALVEATPSMFGRDVDGHRPRRAGSPALPTVNAAAAPAFDDPVDANIVEFTASPSYEQDHTVFATGNAKQCESAVGCPALYKSSDGGTTWERLPAAGRGAGSLLLPPAYPRDNRIFSQGVRSLSVSEDEGRTFRHLTTVHGPVTMSPLFSAGDPRFLIGNAWGRPGPLFEYLDGEQAPRPLSLPLPPNVIPFTVLFSPTYATDSRVLVAGHQVQHGVLADLGSVRSTVLSCQPASCTPVLDDVGILQFVGASTSAVYTVGSELYRSRDGGRSFESVSMPTGRAGAVVSALAVASDGALFLSVFENGFDDTDLYVSRDEAETWHRLQAPNGDLFTEMLSLPDGRLLAARALPNGRSLHCSVDSGRTWARRCPPRPAP